MTFTMYALIALAIVAAMWLATMWTNAITSSLVSNLTDTETCNGTSGTIQASSLNETVNLTGSTSPAVSARASFSQALTSGAATISLEALPGLTAFETVNGVGLKVQTVKFQNPASNANLITIGKGATNGHRLDGTTAWLIGLAPGMSVLINCDAGGDTIGSSHLNWDMTGTGSQALNVQVCLG